MDAKKIGIITLNGYFNYGNRLQNYALQKCLEKKMFKVETLVIKQENEGKNEKKFDGFIKLSFARKISVIFNKVNSRKFKELNNKRSSKFKEFTYENILEIKYEDRNRGKDYEYFITGSDQVWNPNDKLVTEKNFLTFAEFDKRIAYAPSFGVSKIDDSLKKTYSSWLNGIKHISVREEVGAEIINEITGREATVLVDPTMLLNKEEWLKVAREDIEKPKEKYLLTYFLGGIPREYRSYIKEVARKNNLKIVDLANIKVSKYYVNGPSEFIDYINSAELFMTDSFHGCVFSMIMETPFIVCKRSGHTSKEDMYSRIDTFVSKFKLQGRKFENISEENLFKIDYRESQKILKKEKEKSHKFLNNALEIKSKV